MYDPGSPSAPTRAHPSFTRTFLARGPFPVQRASGTRPPRAAAPLAPLHHHRPHPQHRLAGPTRSSGEQARATASRRKIVPVPAELSPHTHHSHVSTHLFTVTCAMHEGAICSHRIRCAPSCSPCAVPCPSTTPSPTIARSGPCPARPLPTPPFSFIVSAGATSSSPRLRLWPRWRRHRLSADIRRTRRCHAHAPPPPPSHTHAGMQPGLPTAPVAYAGGGRWVGTPHAPIGIQTFLTSTASWRISCPSPWCLSNQSRAMP